MMSLDILNLKDLLYSYIFSGNSRVSLYPYEPKSAKVYYRITRDLKLICPDLQILHTGSSALKIFGDRDIDIYLPVSSSKFSIYHPILSALFGPSGQQRLLSVEWHIHQSGFNIDLVLIDPDHPRLMREIKQFTLLKNRPDLLAEYVQMKKESQGFTRGRYTRQKIAFFSKYS